MMSFCATKAFLYHPFMTLLYSYNCTNSITTLRTALTLLLKNFCKQLLIFWSIAKNLPMSSAMMKIIFGFLNFGWVKDELLLLLPLDLVELLRLNLPLLRADLLFPRYNTSLPLASPSWQHTKRSSRASRATACCRFMSVPLTRLK